MKKRVVSLLLIFVIVFTSFTPIVNAKAAVSKDGTTYTVEKGNNLYRIGKELNKDWREIAKLNGIKEPWTIYIGQVLRLTEAENKKAEDKVQKTSRQEQKVDKQEEKQTKSYEDTKLADNDIEKVKHGEIAFDEIVYKRPDFEKIQKDMQDIETLIAKKSGSDTILKAYEEVGNALIEALTAVNYTNIRNYSDVTDTYYAAEFAYVTQTYNVLRNQYMELADHILSSHIGTEAKELWGEEEIEALTRAKMLMNDNTIELSAKEQELKNMYVNSTATVTFDVKGTKMTLNEMLSQTDLTYEEQIKYYYDYIEALNATAGDIYLQLVDVRNQIAKELGFDSYLDYGYFSYERDYTPEQASKLHEYVKEYIVPVYTSLAATLTTEEIMILNSTGGDIASFDSIYRIFFDEISPELQEAYDYMLIYKLYDYNYSPVKTNLSYTTLLYSYHEPYMNIYPTGLYTDISTFVHEFGHFNAYYKHDTNLKLILDIAEIHSQGLELLFTPYYAVYEDAASSIVKYNFIIYLQTLIQGCLEDEFQQYIYNNDITSIKQLNQFYYDLQLDYGLIAESSEKESASWVLITHTFVMPLYYISYATSLVPALKIFDIALKDREAAIDVYNALVEEGTKDTFLSTLKAAGFGSPFNEETIRKISESIGEFFDLSMDEDVVNEVEELDPAA